VAKKRDSPAPVDRLLTPAEVMGMLAIGRTSYYTLLERGELTWVQVGDRKRYRLSEVERYIERQTARTGR